MNAVVDAPASGLPLLGRVLAPPDAPADAHAEKRAEEQERARSYCRDAARRIRRDADVLDALVRWDDELPGLPSLALTVTVRQGGDLTRVVDMVT
ncbi:MAG: hypothetical protein Q4G40_02680, partial [Brachybacterium sp.]|nr:hypothetical protein [Brachybacterium sp.]